VVVRTLKRKRNKKKIILFNKIQPKKNKNKIKYLNRRKKRPSTYNSKEVFGTGSLFPKNKLIRTNKLKCLTVNLK